MFLLANNTMPCLSELSWSANTDARPATVRGTEFPEIERIGKKHLQLGTASVGRQHRPGVTLSHQN